MATPTKPLYTARFSILDTRYYSPAEIFKIFGPGLEKSGFVHYQTPAVKGYTPPFTMGTFSLFTLATDPNSPLYSPGLPFSEADPSTVPVYEVIYFKTPDGKPYNMMRQFADIAESDTQSFTPRDKIGTRPIVEKRSPKITTIAWNLGAKAYSKDIEKAIADRIWEIRVGRVYNPDRYTGAGWRPIVLPWASAPLKLANYPDRPPVPKKLLPVTPKPPPPPPPPKPVPPKPVPPKPVPPKPVPPKPPEPEEPTFFQKYWAWLLGGGIVAVYLMNQKTPKRQNPRYYPDRLTYNQKLDAAYDAKFYPGLSPIARKYPGPEKPHGEHPQGRGEPQFDDSDYQTDY